MGSFTDYMENKIVGHVLSGVSWTPPTTYYAALFTIAPGESTAGTEASAGSYARQSCTFTTSGSVASNAAQIEFPVSTTDHGTINGFGIFDASTSGNLVSYHVMSPTKTYNTGETIRATAGSLTITLD